MNSSKPLTKPQCMYFNATKTSTNQQSEIQTDKTNEGNKCKANDAGKK